jgi:hypothetical protein
MLNVCVCATVPVIAVTASAVVMVVAPATQADPVLLSAVATVATRAVRATTICPYAVPLHSNGPMAPPAPIELMNTMGMTAACAAFGTVTVNTFVAAASTRARLRRRTRVLALSAGQSATDGKGWRHRDASRATRSRAPRDHRGALRRSAVAMPATTRLRLATRALVVSRGDFAGRTQGIDMIATNRNPPLIAK